MALDAATAHIVTSFQEVGLPTMLLKGPAMAERLYADDVSQRGYNDIDLLVPPHLFAAAGQALYINGYVRATPAGPSPSIGARLYEETWLRVDNSELAVDLHRGFHGVGRQETFWEILHGQAESLRVSGTDVAVPDVPGCALVVALHAWSDGSPKKTLADLDRALNLFDDGTWRQASEIAATCGALAAFTVGLRKRPEGVQLVERLGLSSAAAPAIWLRSAAAPAGTVVVGHLLSVPGWRRRLMLTPRLAFPSREYMRGWARRHPVGQPAHPPGLGSAYAVRLFNGCRALPAAVGNWRASSRAAAESGWVPSRRHRAATSKRP
jgi:hypothetical protein